MKLGRSAQSLVYLRRVGFITTFLYSILFEEFLNPSFKSLIPTCPLMFRPHEKIYPFSVKHNEWLNPPETLTIFLCYPFTLIFSFVGRGYLIFRPVPVAPEIASPHEYKAPSSSIANEW